LNLKLRELISKKIDCGPDIWRLGIRLYLKNINQPATKLEVKPVNYKKRNNAMSLGNVSKIQRSSGSTLTVNVKSKPALET